VALSKAKNKLPVRLALPLDPVEAMRALLKVDPESGPVETQAAEATARPPRALLRGGETLATADTKRAPKWGPSNTPTNVDGEDDTSFAPYRQARRIPLANS
jgi:hypothetical protein